MPFYLVSISDEYYDYGDGYGYFYINEAMLKETVEELKGIDSYRFCDDSLV